jgi:hypothetical protein
MDGAFLYGFEGLWERTWVKENGDLGVIKEFFPHLRANMSNIMFHNQKYHI